MIISKRNLNSKQRKGSFLKSNQIEIKTVKGHHVLAIMKRDRVWPHFQPESPKTPHVASFLKCNYSCKQHHICVRHEGHKPLLWGA